MAAQHFRLLDLPAELRFKIYDYWCPEPRNEPQSFDSTQALRLIKQPILQANRSLRSDVLHHHYKSRVVTIFINSPCNVGLDFLAAETAYAAITRIELMVFCSLETYRENGRCVILSDYQQRQLEAAFSFTDKTENLQYVALSCSVMPGIMQFPRRPELYKRFEDMEVLSKLGSWSVTLWWAPASATRSYPNEEELAFATGACDVALKQRLPHLTSLGVQCLESCCSWKLQRPIRTIQTSCTFGRKAQNRQCRKPSFWMS